ncbi:CoA transferase [Corynebacterium lubricantis]|uniref:CoA transferase n=1 Tax=Corynebacterium lubricantis TaxID=541095 RepID=UPI00036ED7D3|nr:CoA transferase [Corynebacterium lubricantis]
MSEASEHSPQYATMLQGRTVVTIAPNLPGPAAARNLLRMGAQVIKVESPAGDPMELYNKEYYDWLNAGQSIITLDLRADLSTLHALLERADLLITSSRLDSLERLGLSFEEIHARYPKLGYIAVVGHIGDQASTPGHDLTYQAEAGALHPPHYPKQAVADLAGSERATTSALAALMIADATGEGTFHEVSLAGMAAYFSSPSDFGLSSPGSLLSGGLAGYGFYKSSDDQWLALGALEPKFLTVVCEEAGIDPSASQDDQRTAFTTLFAQRTASEWESWATQQSIPLVAVKD